MHASIWQSTSLSLTAFGLVVLAALGLAACAGNPLDPGAGDAPGTGTQTLGVEGAVSSSPRVPNAARADDFDTQFDVRLTRGQTPIATGTVTVTSNGGAVDLTFDTADGGHWTGRQAGYFEVYQLDVTSGDDAITGVIVDGPDAHHFTEPALGGTVDASQPVDLAWSRIDRADEAQLWTRELDPTAVEDSGTYTLATGSLRSSKDQTEDETIGLLRSNRVSPAGAVAGSEVTVSVSNDIDVVIAINPNAR